MGRAARGTARARHVSVRHGTARACFGEARGTARHGTHVGRAGLRILGTQALKHGTIRDGPKHSTRKSTFITSEKANWDSFGDSFLKLEEGFPGKMQDGGVL
ncbi:hypothetical protein WN944_015273 [Citrus x changshan-huyou]|uniref:Uncharacterized protein n=1 Tax=Citrus x changshan-huyou TaxID=2935761 RepID=A0AAP0M775_9ROSI